MLSVQLIENRLAGTTLQHDALVSEAPERLTTPLFPVGPVHYRRTVA